MTPDPAMPLTLEFGHATATGPRERNEDYGGYVEPEGQLAATKGMLAVVADGVSGGSHGREAAEASVRNLLADYYSTPDTVSDTRAALACFSKKGKIFS